MLQRQIMFRQLQELQRRQQLEDNSRNQNYTNQLSSLKQTSGDHFPATVNGMSVQDSSRMFIVGNIQMMQHGGTNGTVLSQSPVGQSQLQSDVSLYGTHAPITDKNFNQYSSPLGPSSVFSSSFTSHRCSFSSNQVSMPDGSLLSNPDKNLFGQVPVEGVGLSQPAASLDPLEQKILYNTDDNSWESCTVEHPSHMDALPSLQSGSWSALMQSAVAETSSSDTGIREEWSGMSFQNNPEPLNETQPTNFNDIEKLRSNLFQNFNMNCGFASFQQSGHQYLKQREEYHSESSHGTMQHSPRNTSNLGYYNSQLIQTSLPLSNVWPGQHKEQSNSDTHQPTILSCSNDNQPHDNFSGHEIRGDFWLQGSSTSQHVPGGIQMPCDQVNQLNSHRHSVEPENLAPRENVESVTAPSVSMLELLNKDDISNDPTPTMQSNSKDSIPGEIPSTETSRVSPNFGFRLQPTDPRTPQSYSLFPSFSMGTSSQPFFTSNMLQHVGFPTGLPNPWPDIATQQDSSSLKPHKFSSNLFRSSDSASSSLETSSGAPNDQQNQNSIQHEYNVQEFGKYSGKSEFHEQKMEKGSSIGSNEASNLTYQSQISLQMAPSLFKHYGTLKNGQMLPMYDPKAAINARQPLSEMTLGNLQENSLLMQRNLANTIQGASLCPSSTCKPLDQNLAVSIPKKRKVVVLDMVPWHKEINHERSRLLDISTSELAWGQALSRREEEVMEVKNEAENFEELSPLIRAKRRLICTTQLMQQAFRPAPAVILTSSNCDYVAYYAARSTLGHACSLTCQLLSDTNGVLLDKLKTSKTTNVHELSKVVEGFINQVKKLEGDLLRLEKSLSFIDIKVEAQELEKFSIINRFAKFHIKAHPSTVDPASSYSTSILLKNPPQKYVIAVPMPRILPEGVDCLSL